VVAGTWYCRGRWRLDAVNWSVLSSAASGTRRSCSQLCAASASCVLFQRLTDGTCTLLWRGGGQSQEPYRFSGAVDSAVDATCAKDPLDRFLLGEVPYVPAGERK
jgi:hypothetical protein